MINKISFGRLSTRQYVFSIIVLAWVVSLVMLFERFYRLASLRYFVVLFALISACLTFYVAIEYYNFLCQKLTDLEKKLRDKSQLWDSVKNSTDFRKIAINDFSKEIKKIKLLAEIFAGIALFGLVMQFFTVGNDIDRDNTDGRISLLINAGTIVNTQLTFTYCETLKIKESCNEVKDKLQSTIKKFRSVASEKEIKSSITSLIESIKNIKHSNYSVGDRLNLAIPLIERSKVDSDLTSTLLRFVVLSISTIAAILAISRKIALAAYDMSDSKKFLDIMSFCAAAKKYLMWMISK